MSPDNPTKKPRSFGDHIDLFFKAKECKKFRRGITVMVKNDEYNNSKIYNTLRMRGFAKKPNSNECYGKTTFLQYVKYVRNKYNKPARDKSDRIAAMLKQKIPRHVIREELTTSNAYILEIATRYNLPINKGKHGR